MTVIRQILRLAPALLLAAVVAAVACQQSDASQDTAPRVAPGEPATVAEGGEPGEGGLLGGILGREPISLRVPAGTDLQVRLLQPLSTEVSRRGQGFLAAVAEDVRVDDRVAIPSGARVTGTVRDVRLASEGDGALRLALSFDAVELPSGGSARLDGAVEAEGERPKLVLPAGSLLTFTLQSPAQVELALDA